MNIITTIDHASRCICKQLYCIHGNSHKSLVLLRVNLVVLLNELRSACLPARNLQGNIQAHRIVKHLCTTYTQLPQCTHTPSHHTSHPLTPPHTHTAYTTSAHPSAQEITSFLRAVDSAMRESFCAVSCLVLSLSGASSSSSSWDFFSAADSYSPVQTRAQPLQRTSIHATTTHQWCCVVHTLSTSEVCSSLRRRLLSRRRFRLSRRSSTSAC